jgi:hypothetical protein
MAAQFILTTETANITSGDLVRNVFSGIGVLGGAAQDMDLLLDTRPLPDRFMQL